MGARGGTAYGMASEPVVHWSERAACRDDPDPDDWHPVGNGGTTGAGADRAKGICNGDCPVRRECLDYALARRGIHGIWGGLDDEQRRKLRAGTRLPTSAWRLCRNGLHEMTADNTGLVPSEGFRHCKACRADRAARITERARERQRAYRSRKRAEPQAVSS